MNRGKRRVDTPNYAGMKREIRRKSNNYLLNLLDRLSPGINHLMVIYSNAEIKGNRRGFASRYRLLSKGGKSFYRRWQESLN